MMSAQNFATAPKTDSFRFRINPELREQAEGVYAKCGLSLTDAINVFLQQSLNTGGFPFAGSKDNADVVRAKALSRLMKELSDAEQSGEPIDEEDVYRSFGVTL